MGFLFKINAKKEKEKKKRKERVLKQCYVYFVFHIIFFLPDRRHVVSSISAFFFLNRLSLSLFSVSSTKIRTNVSFFYRFSQKKTIYFQLDP